MKSKSKKLRLTQLMLILAVILAGSLLAAMPLAGAINPGPEITLNPASGPSGTVVTVSGVGFRSEVDMTALAFDGSILWLNIITDANGSFTVNFTVPVKSITGIYEVLVFDLIEPYITEAFFTLTPGITDISADSETLSHSGGESLITLTGTNLPNGIMVTAFDGEVATSITGTTNGGDTSQTVTLNFPANTAFADKVYAIKASLDGGESWESATSPVTVEWDISAVTCAITINPASGPSGTVVTVTGAGFLSGINTIEIEFDNVLVRQDIETDEDGSFTVTFTVPGKSAVGEYEVLAADTAMPNVFCAVASFTLTPGITDMSAAPATLSHSGGESLITVTGTNLPSGIMVTAFDGSTATAITGTTDGSDASQTVTLSFPANTDIADKVYAIKASLDGGESWDSATSAVTVEGVIPAVTYVITFNPSGGAVSPASAETGADGRLSGLPTPTRSGSYAFNGWWTATSGGELVTTSYVFTADTIIYASWTYTGGSSTDLLSYANASISPVKADFVKNGGGDITVTLYRGDFSPRALTNGSYTLIAGADYTVNGNVYTIKATYLNTLSEGTWTIVFNMSGGADPKLTVTVKNIASKPIAPLPITPELPVNPFADVKGTDWFIDDVIYAYNKGLMFGTSVNPMLFSPNIAVTRAMIATILYRVEGEPDAAGLPNPFDDVTQGQWYTNAIKWAADAGIVEGYGTGKFGPNDSIHRENLVAILMRYMAYKKINIAVTANWIFFADEAYISDFAMNAIQTFYKLGIMKGVGTDSEGRVIIDPKGDATRAQAAATLRRFFLHTSNAR